MLKVQSVLEAVVSRFQTIRRRLPELSQLLLAIPIIYHTSIINTDLHPSFILKCGSPDYVADYRTITLDEELRILEYLKDDVREILLQLRPLDHIPQQCSIESYLNNEPNIEK